MSTDSVLTDTTFGRWICEVPVVGTDTDASTVAVVAVERAGVFGASSIAIVMNDKVQLLRVSSKSREVIH